MTLKLEIRVVYLLAATVLLASAVAATTVDTLGTLDFPNSGAPEAQDAFVRGVLLLHSFEYDDAREAFVEAQQIDPDFAMAYWGEAMTYNHPLWRWQDREAALEVLGKIPDHELTAREQSYLDALAILYGEGDKVARDITYAEAMRQLSASHPDDLEAKSFYALSILGTTQAVRDFRTFMKAGAVAEEVFASNPRHPGAAHYLIHSYDDPVHAPLGLRAARVYAEIAPAASHAQHMISHIYVALGDWANSVDSNIKSFEVSRERAARKNLPIDDLNFHSYHWLEYSYLQMAQFDRARPMVDQMRQYALETGTPRARGYYAGMRASWIVESGGRDAPESIGTETMGPTAAAGDLFATGVSAIAGGDPAGAKTALESLDQRLQGLTPSPDDKVGVETRRTVQVIADSLEAVIAWTEGRRDQAISLLEGATAIEGSLALEYGPPSIVKPSNELFGEVLLAAGQPGAAAEQFEQALQRAPRRRLSLLGLAQASAASADLATNERACAALAEILGDMEISYCEG